MNRRRRNPQPVEARPDRWSDDKFPFDPQFGDTPEIQAYRTEWVRAAAFWHGRMDRPFAQVAFRHVRVQVAPGVYDSPPFNAKQLLLDPQQVQAVMLSRIRREQWASNRLRLHAVVSDLTFTDQEGPRIGGVKECLRQVYDFARVPRLDTQSFVEQRSLGVLRSPWSGVFSVVESEQFVDLCVGSLPGYPLRPQIAYRIPRERMEGIEVTHASTVRAGDVLAQLPQRIVYGCAELDANRHPVVRRLGESSEIVPASRRPDVLRLLNQMNREQNDHLAELNPGGTPPWVNMEDWLPAALVEFPAELADSFASLPEFQITNWLKQQVLEAIGPNGNFTIKAEHDGELLDVAPVPHQEHLKCVSFESGGEIREQHIPASSVLFSTKSYRRGQPLADVCPRIRFFNYTDLENELGLNSGWVMLEVLKELFLRPGHAGWEGPGCLLDIRAVPPALLAAAVRREKGEISWRLDCRRGAKYLNEAGCLVYPPFPLSGLSVQGKGVHYSFDPLDRRYRGTGSAFKESSAAAPVGI